MLKWGRFQNHPKSSGLFSLENSKKDHFFGAMLSQERYAYLALEPTADGTMDLVVERREAGSVWVCNIGKQVFSLFFLRII